MCSRQHAEPVALAARPIAAAYVRLVLEALDVAPEARDRVLGEAGLAGRDVQAGREAYVAFGKAARLLQAVSSGLPEDWYLALAPRLDAAAHGPLGIALLTSATLAEAIETLIAWAEVRFPFVWFTQTVDRSCCVVGCLPQGDLGDLRRPLLELAVIGVARLVGQVSGRTGSGLTVRLPGGPPPHAGRLRQVMGAPIDFGADGFEVEFPTAWLGEPGLYADEGMYRLSVAKCRDLRGAALARSALEISIRQELLARRGRSPGLDALARSRHMSARTLMRRLEQQGTSYRELLAGVQAGLAADLLRHTDLPVAEIAGRLGFADPANFGRAFRGWYGMPPGRYRGR